MNCYRYWVWIGTLLNVLIPFLRNFFKLDFHLYFFIFQIKSPGWELLKHFSLVLRANDPPTSSSSSPFRMLSSPPTFDTLV